MRPLSSAMRAFASASACLVSDFIFPPPGPPSRPSSAPYTPRMDRADILTRFLETLPYTPYPFQEEALLAWFTSDAGVMICAPTGMGKTTIAEAAVYEALLTRR